MRGYSAELQQNGGQESSGPPACLLLPEVVETIFSHLSWDDLECGRLVCRTWRRALCRGTGRLVVPVLHGRAAEPLRCAWDSPPARQLLAAARCVHLRLLGGEGASAHAAAASSPPAAAGARAAPEGQLAQGTTGSGRGCSLGGVLTAARPSCLVLDATEVRECRSATASGGQPAGSACSALPGAPPPPQLHEWLQLLHTAAGTEALEVPAAAPVATTGAGSAAAPDGAAPGCCSSPSSTRGQQLRHLSVLGDWAIQPAAAGGLASWLPNLTHLSLSSHAPGGGAPQRGAPDGHRDGPSTSSSSCCFCCSGSRMGAVGASRAADLVAGGGGVGSGVWGAGGRGAGGRSPSAPPGVDLPTLMALTSLQHLQHLQSPLLIRDQDRVGGRHGACWSRALAGLSALSRLTSLHFGTAPMPQPAAAAAAASGGADGTAAAVAGVGAGAAGAAVVLGSALCLLPELADAVRGWGATMPQLRHLGLALAECCHSHPDQEGALWEDPDCGWAAAGWRGVFPALTQLVSLQLVADRITDELWSDLRSCCSAAPPGDPPPTGTAPAAGPQQSHHEHSDSAFDQRVAAGDPGASEAAAAHLQQIALHPQAHPVALPLDAREAAPAGQREPGGVRGLEALVLHQTDWGGAYEAAGLRELASCSALGLTLGDCGGLQELSSLTRLTWLELRLLGMDYEPGPGDVLASGAGSGGCDAALGGAAATGAEGLLGVLQPPLDATGAPVALAALHTPGQAHAGLLRQVTHGSLRLRRLVMMSRSAVLDLGELQHLPRSCPQLLTLELRAPLAGGGSCSTSAGAAGGGGGSTPVALPGCLRELLLHNTDAGGAGGPLRGSLGARGSPPVLSLAHLPQSLSLLQLTGLTVCIAQAQGEGGGGGGGAGASGHGGGSVGDGGEGAGGGGCADGAVGVGAEGVEAVGGAPRTVRVQLVRCMVRCGLEALCGPAAREVTVVQCGLQLPAVAPAHPMQHAPSSQAAAPAVASPAAALSAAGALGSGAAALLPHLCDCLHMLRSLVVWNCRGPHLRPWGDDALQHLVAHLPRLELLAVNATAATPTGLQFVGRLRQLRGLRIAVANIACATALAAGLAQLRGLQRVAVCVPPGGTQFVLECARDHLVGCLPGVHVQLQCVQ